MDKHQNVKSDTGFLVTFGIIFMASGALGAIGIISAFDWDTFNKINNGYSVGLDNVVKPDIASMFTKAGASLLGGVSVGVLFIAIDRIALTLKKIQFGIRHNPKSRKGESETDEEKGYSSL